MTDEPGPEDDQPPSPSQTGDGAEAPADGTVGSGQSAGPGGPTDRSPAFPGRQTAGGVRTGDQPAADTGGDSSRCDYCRLPIPADAVQLQRNDVTYRFCSGACRDALVDQETVFTEYHGHRRFATGVSVLDASLPQGVPRNSFVTLSEVAGSRVEALQCELAWRTLQRGEPVVFVTFLEPPVSVVQGFVDMEWNVLPSLERGDLRIVDCFSYRVEDRDRMYERMNAWNRHLWDVASEATTTVRDPSDMSELQNRIDGVLEDGDVHDRGIVVVDSLVELGSLVQPVQAYNFVKDVRADVSKGRFVPIFAGATVGHEGDGFPHDLEYMVDGIVELNLTEELVENELLKQLRVRKMGGVLTYPQWQVFEYTPGAGAVGYDPVAQQAANQDASGETNEASGGGTRSGSGSQSGGGGQAGPGGGGHAGGQSGSAGPPAGGPDEGGPGPDGGTQGGPGG